MSIVQLAQSVFCLVFRPTSVYLREYFVFCFLLSPQSEPNGSIELMSYKRKSEDGVFEQVALDEKPPIPVDMTDVALQGVEQEADIKALNMRMKNMAKMLCLAVAYSANIGGMATLTGTPPNLVLDNVAGA